MRRLPAIGLGLVGAVLAGCAAAPEPAPDASGSATAPQATSSPESFTASQPESGPSFLSIVGTPFLIAFKIPVCIITVVVAAPLAGISELSDNPGGRDMRRQLQHAIDHNCGPPYVLTP